MCGGGTTLIECKLTGRNSIGVDINPDAIMVSLDRLKFYDPSLKKTQQKTYVGDARNLNLIENESIDLIATHPPYANIIEYSEKGVPGDLSHVGSVDDFIENMFLVAKECYRVLKPGKYCAILVGDTRKKGHYIPIAPRVLDKFLKAGFILKENIIKNQWNCKTTKYWEEQSKRYNFLLIMHENLFIFRKLKEEEKSSQFKDSMKCR
jgi:DNA modification methylase